jgi:putative oxidoreductase
MHTQEFERSLVSGAPLVGRILMSMIFIMSGISKFTNWQMTEHMMAAHGLPLYTVLHVVSGIVEILGGIAILTGFQARWGAWALFLYLIPVTVVMHNFWAYQGPEHMMQQINFMKNLAIMGGLLYIGTFGAGNFALGRRDRFEMPDYMRSYNQETRT